MKIDPLHPAHARPAARASGRRDAGFGTTAARPWPCLATMPLRRGAATRLWRCWWTPFCASGAPVRESPLLPGLHHTPQPEHRHAHKPQTDTGAWRRREEEHRETYILSTLGPDFVSRVWYSLTEAQRVSRPVAGGGQKARARRWCACVLPAIHPRAFPLPFCSAAAG